MATKKKQPEEVQKTVHTVKSIGEAMARIRKKLSSPVKSQKAEGEEELEILTKEFKEQKNVLRPSLKKK